MQTLLCRSAISLTTSFQTTVLFCRTVLPSLPSVCLYMIILWPVKCSFLLNTVPAFNLKRLPDLKNVITVLYVSVPHSSNCSRNEVELISAVCEDLPRINPQTVSARPHLGSQSFIQCEACNLLRQLPHQHVVVCRRGWPSVTARILNRVVHSCAYQYTFI